MTPPARKPKRKATAHDCSRQFKCASHTGTLMRRVLSLKSARRLGAHRSPATQIERASTLRCARNGGITSTPFRQCRRLRTHFTAFACIQCRVPLRRTNTLSDLRNLASLRLSEPLVRTTNTSSQARPRCSYFCAWEYNLNNENQICKNRTDFFAVMSDRLLVI